MRFIFLNSSPFPLRRFISSSETTPEGSGTTALVGVEHAGGAACGVVQSSTVHFRHWLNFPGHYENWHLLSCLFPWQQYQGLPAELIDCNFCLQELMQREGVGFGFPLVRLV